MLRASLVIETLSPKWRTYKELLRSYVEIVNNTNTQHSCMRTIVTMRILYYLHLYTDAQQIRVSCKITIKRPKPVTSSS